MPGFKIPINNACHGPNAFLADSQSYALTDIETARNHRFTIEFLEPLGDARSGLIVYVKRCTRPAPDIDEIVIYNGQDVIKRPGKPIWRAIDITFYEMLSPVDNPNLDRAAQLIYDWYKRIIKIDNSLHGEVSDYYQTALITMDNGKDDIVWRYQLCDCWPVKFIRSDLDMSDSNISEIGFTLNYNRCYELPP